MAARLPRIVLDTRVLMAALRSKRGAAHEVLVQVTQDVFTVHLSLPLMLQYREVIGRQSAELAFDEVEIGDILTAIGSLAVVHKIHFLLRPVSTDPGDEMVLELAFAARAEYIVTHNIRHFAGASTYGSEAVTPIQFLRRIGVSR